MAKIKKINRNWRDFDFEAAAAVWTPWMAVKNTNWTWWDSEWTFGWTYWEKKNKTYTYFAKDIEGKEMRRQQRWWCLSRYFVSPKYTKSLLLFSFCLLVCLCVRTPSRDMTVISGSVDGTKALSTVDKNAYTQLKPICFGIILSSYTIHLLYIIFIIFSLLCLHMCVWVCRCESSIVFFHFFLSILSLFLNGLHTYTHKESKKK